MWKTAAGGNQTKLTIQGFCFSMRTLSAELVGLRVEVVICYAKREIFDSTKRNPMKQTVTFSNINPQVAQPGETSTGASHCGPVTASVRVTAGITNDTSGGAITLLYVTSFVIIQDRRRVRGQSNGVTPLAVATGEYVEITVQFAPTASTPNNCTATLQINGDTWNPVSLPVTAVVCEVKVSVPPITVFIGGSASVGIGVTLVAGNATIASLYLQDNASPGAPQVTASLSPSSLSVSEGQYAFAKLSISASSALPASSDLPAGSYAWILWVRAYNGAYAFTMPVTINVVARYYCIKSKLNGNVIDVIGASTNAGAGLDAYPQKLSGNDNQLWLIAVDPAGSGYYFIKSKLNGNVIDIQGASTTAGALLDAYTQKFSGNDNQLWEFALDPAGSGYYFIKSKLNGNVIDIQGASTTAGVLLDAFPQKPSGNDNQLWEFVADPVGSGCYFIKSKLNGNVIDIQGASTRAGALLDAFPQKPSGNENQLWEFVGSDYFLIVSKLNGNVIDIQGASTRAGALLDVYTLKSSGNDNQLWEFVADPAGSGYCFIKSKLNGNVIDIEGASTEPGARLDAYPWKLTGYDNQLWTVVDGSFPSVVGTVAPGRGKLPNSGYYNYVLANGSSCATLTRVKATIYFTEDLVWESSSQPDHPGFSIQLNAETSNNQPLDWLQFVVHMGDDQGLWPWINIWTPASIPTGVPFWDQTVANPVANMPQAARIPAGYSIVIALQNDSAGSVTGATWSVLDSSGTPVPVSSPLKNPVSYPLSNTEGGGVPPADLSQIASFQVTFGGALGGAYATFSSGAGVIIYEADQAMTVDWWPACIGYTGGTAESSNIAYSVLEATTSTLFSQAFGVVQDSAQMREANPNARKLPVKAFPG